MQRRRSKSGTRIRRSRSEFCNYLASFYTFPSCSSLTPTFILLMPACFQPLLVAHRSTEGGPMRRHGERLCGSRQAVRTSRLQGAARPHVPGHVQRLLLRPTGGFRVQGRLAVVLEEETLLQHLVLSRTHGPCVPVHVFFLLIACCLVCLRDGSCFLFPRLSNSF